MIDTIYIEEAIESHSKTQSILKRFPKAHQVLCNRYTEIFNVKSQQFKLQKQKPSLILAQKLGKKVIPTPTGYSIGNDYNYYFSHMLNCLYDCRYCFLQGMFNSAHYVVFVNFEDFQSEIEKSMEECKSGATFYSGYDGDSLSFDHITHFFQDFWPLFKKHPSHQLEIRTKSANVRSILQHTPLENIIIACSLNPQWVVERFEAKTARLHQRLRFLQKLQERGWPIGLRFDPVIYHPDWKQNYSNFFDEVFKVLDPSRIHSTTLGPFRLPRSIYKSMQSQFPSEPLLFHQIESGTKLITYKKEIEQEMHEFCSNIILNYISKSSFHPSLF